LFQTPSVSSQFVSLQASTLHDLPHLPRQTMDEFCPQFDRRFCQGGMNGPDASTDTAPRFENRNPETSLAERLRASESSNSSSDYHNLRNPFGHAFSVTEPEQMSSR
jgi:hypothetical protein